jgi:hypothetical protein
MWSEELGLDRLGDIEMRVSTMVVTLALTLYWVDAMIGDVARLWWGPLAVNYLTMVCIWVTMYCMDCISQPFRQGSMERHPAGNVIAWESAYARAGQMSVLGLDRRAS